MKGKTKGEGLQMSFPTRESILRTLSTFIRHRAFARRRVWAALGYVPWAQYLSNGYGLWFWSWKMSTGGGGHGIRRIEESLDPPHPNRLRQLQDASKTRPHVFFPHHFCDVFWDGFFVDVCTNLAPTCIPKPTNINNKSMPRAIPILASLFNRFLIDFCLIFRSLNPHFFKLYWIYNMFLPFSLLKIRSIYGCSFDPTWLGF